ncbi:iron chaperone [Sporosarcina sp. P13]|uniref:iron chaperone n=1 Tax=Sporosarcina sp. P13 TaxID=2048263 RepID=UPI000C16B247|nr:iron chaperone [Sporosarcina sp. P13]PIC64109.1 iron chaperone [Sporosarcina sp. P13]
MEVFSTYVAGIDNPDHRDRIEEVLKWVANEFPNLEPVIKWNTPMFANQGTFIIGFSTAKHHMSVSPELAGITHFADDIADAGYSATKGLFRIKWNEPVNYELIKKMIEFTIQDKIECKTFWRK